MKPSVRVNLLTPRPTRVPFSHRPTRDLSALIECVLCDGLGFVMGILFWPLVVPCRCTAGLRLQSSLHDLQKPWPMGITSAQKLASRIGLECADPSWRAERRIAFEDDWRTDSRARETRAS